ncbi:Zn-dependent membrane protease YugP [Prosthecobacter fusiformis]|uniref:Zn-dependent membrane protease YugP n=1 Tax=Prosthecobacter fusiformis TaxID=48464 RepID=A0A4R7SPQ6_9BACT|nr:zinc metallopeptidase [Prosthecobacter fusiformis]TDU81190.1 Zn-dependent membrane protease YugP [Prosthecobacter fusiformis]
MLALFILVLLFCFGVCQWAAGRYAQVQGPGMKERAPTAHTGAEIARLFLAYEDATDVEIIEHDSMASDYFDPRRRRLFLQPKVARGTSMGAWAIALHEAAHATQTEAALGDLKWRQNVIRLNRYGPIFGLVGVAAMMFLRFPPRFAIAALVAVCVMLLLLNIGTLAVEYNANARLRRFLENHLERHPDAHERLTGYLSRVAVREVGDLLRSPRYFLFSALPGSGKIRPVK